MDYVCTLRAEKYHDCVQEADKGPGAEVFEDCLIFLLRKAEDFLENQTC